MAVGLVKEPIKLNRIVGEESIQTLVEGDIVVPDSKPDISKVLAVKCKVKITDKEIVQGKVLVDGVVNFLVLYTSQDADSKPVHSMNASATFSESIEIAGIDSTMHAEVDYLLEHIDFNILNERKISVKAVINLKVRVYKNQEAEIVGRVEGLDNIQALEDSIQYDVEVGTDTGQSVLRETYELTEETPAIAEIISVEGVPVVNEVKVTDGKVLVGGIINIKILYSTEEPRKPVQEIKHEMPFTQFIEMPKAHEGMKCKVNANVENIYTEVKENLQEEKKVYDIEVLIKVMAKLYDKENKRVITDAYCPDRNLNPVKGKFKYLKDIHCNSSQGVIKETLGVPEGMPNIFEIFTIEAQPYVTSTRLIEEKDIIEGFILATAIYIGDTEGMEAYSFSQEIPFRHYIDMPGTMDEMPTHVSVMISDIDYSKVNPKQIEFKCNLWAEGSALEEKEGEMVIDIEDLGELEETKDSPSIIVYFVQEGDTLWKIAKRYNTTVKDIVEANDIENPDALSTGQPIIIQRTYKCKI